MIACVSNGQPVTARRKSDSIWCLRQVSLGSFRLPVSATANQSPLSLSLALDLRELAYVCVHLQGEEEEEEEEGHFLFHDPIERPRTPAGESIY